MKLSACELAPLEVCVPPALAGDPALARREGRDIAGRYWALLQEYLASGVGAFARPGYELARHALVEECGALEIAAAHHLALQRLLATRRADDRLLAAAGKFFAQCVSPFDARPRGALEETRALLHLNEVLEGELKRIAHVLHDEAGQLLASVHLALMDIASEFPPPARARFVKVERLLAQIENELRSLSHEWCPTVLDDLGLLPALEFLAEKVARRTGVKVSVTGEAGERLPNAVEMALYRIAQEALNNAVKHAAARTVWIELQRLPREVTCSVRDNGKGFDADRSPPAARGLGLIGIRERVAALGGSLRLVTRPLNGTTLHAAIPLTN
ncbi:MAG: sensor histidine kinase [Burkholderiales bacterium]